VSVRFRWRTYLRSATTEDAVIDVVRVYLDSWSPDEIARVPAGVWPLSIRTGRELIREALKVGQAHSTFAGTRQGLALLQELLLFLTQASVRVAQLTPLPGEGASIPEPVQRPVGGKVLTEEERKLFEAPPVAAPAKPVKDSE
jgi:hypothetical protein